MSGTLFVVATPIGNLEDITFRALRVLRDADVIAAEDTRRTAKLLRHYEITTPTLSFHQHNTRTRIPQLIRRLTSGERVAMVTDAGTPGISDPGFELVEACLNKGIPVDPVPGASAPLAAASASGFPLDPLTIFGFAPARARQRRAWLEHVLELDHTLTFFEAPHRIRQTLEDIQPILGNRQIVVWRELTKVHQQQVRGQPAAIIGLLPDLRGEFTVVVGPKGPETAGVGSFSDQDIWAEFGQSTDFIPGGRRLTIATLARKFGRSRKEVYAIIEKHKKSGV